MTELEKLARADGEDVSGYLLKRGYVSLKDLQEMEFRAGRLEIHNSHLLSELVRLIAFIERRHGRAEQAVKAMEGQESSPDYWQAEARAHEIHDVLAVARDIGRTAAICPPVPAMDLRAKLEQAVLAKESAKAQADHFLHRALVAEDRLAALERPRSS